MKNYTMKDIGIKIREIRKNKGIQIKEVAETTGLTSSFISQFERGLTRASINSIIKIADVLDVNFTEILNDQLVETYDEEINIVRKEDRAVINYGFESTSKLTEHLLTPFENNLEVYISKVKPGAKTERPYAHRGKEFFYILNGELNIEIKEKVYLLKSGDSVTLNNQILKSWENPHYEITEVLWVIYRVKKS